MFLILPESAGKLAALKAIGKLTDEDYKAVVPQLEEVITAQGALRLLADLEEFRRIPVCYPSPLRVPGSNCAGDCPKTPDIPTQSLSRSWRNY